MQTSLSATGLLTNPSTRQVLDLPLVERVKGQLATTSSLLPSGYKYSFTYNGKRISSHHPISYYLTLNITCAYYSDNQVLILTPEGGYKETPPLLRNELTVYCFAGVLINLCRITLVGTINLTLKITS